MIWNNVSQAYCVHIGRKSGRRNPQDYDTGQRTSEKAVAAEGGERMDDDIRVNSQSVEDLLRDALMHQEESWPEP